MGPEKNTPLEQLVDEAMEQADLKLVGSIESLLSDILTNCDYTRTKDEVEAYQKGVIEAANRG